MLIHLEFGLLLDNVQSHENEMENHHTQKNTTSLIKLLHLMG